MVKGIAALKMLGQSKLYQWGSLGLLVIVGASRWAVASVRADADSTLASLAVGCAWGALLLLAISAARPPSPGESKPRAVDRLRWVLSGSLLFGGPAVALLIPGGDVDSGSLTIALSITPIVIAVACSALGTESSEGIAGRIWPALATIAGLLLLLVQPNLGNLRTDLALLLAPFLTGVGAALFTTVPATDPASRAAATLLGGAALFAVAFAEACVFRGAHASFPVLAIAWDGLIALLSVFALGQLGPTRWSSQFTWIPLLIILESVFMLRPKLSTHWLVGPLLLAVAGVYLLLPQNGETTSEGSPVPNVPV